MALITLSKKETIFLHKLLADYAESFPYKITASQRKLITLFNAAKEQQTMPEVV